MKKSLPFFILAIIGICNSLSAQWNSNTSLNNPICVQNFDQQDVRIVTDGKNGAIITWLDHRNDSINADIYCQRIDKNGFIKWIPNGVIICNDANDQGSINITESNASSVIVAWTDKRNGIGNSCIYIQKLDSNGLPVWNNNGINLTNYPGVHQNPKILSDGLGGAFIVYEDSSSINNFDISAQHINLNGQLDWGISGVSICNSPNKQINPRIETDAQGGFFVCWQDFRNGNDYDIFLQRINSLGISFFNQNGIGICQATNVQSNPKIEPDGQGGAIVAWVDKRNTVDYDLYAQRISGTGQMLWPNNGKCVCNFVGNQSAIELKSIGTNGIVFAWKDGRNPTYSVYVEKLDLNGNSNWAVNGMFISTGINPNLAVDNNGGILMTWQDSVGISWNVYSTRISATSVKLWGGNIIVGNAAKSQIGPKNIGDGFGGAITCWQDKRNGNDFDIYCQHSDSNAKSTLIRNLQIRSKFFHIYPNPCSGRFTITNNSTVSINSITIFSLDGKIVYLKDFKEELTEQTVQINKNTPPGEYLIKIIYEGNKQENQKIIITN